MVKLAVVTVAERDGPIIAGPGAHSAGVHVLARHQVVRLPCRGEADKARLPSDLDEVFLVFDSGYRSHGLWPLGI